MYGSIAKSYMTKSLIESEPSINEVYVKPEFKWSDTEAEFYIMSKTTIPVTSLLNRLNKIWGFGKCRIYITKSFDSLLLAEKRLIYNNRKWVGV